MEQPAPDRDLNVAGPAGRLDSWKEIAAYLRRSPRTVQRWERLEGLPVHRLVHDKQGSVYAFRAELDAWWAERRLQLEAQDDPLPPDEAAEPPKIPLDASSASEAGKPDPTENTTPATESGSPLLAAPAAAARSPRRVQAAFAVVALVLIGTVAALWTLSRTSSSPGPQRVRIAILPFANLTGDPAREFLSDGLTEELIAGLGRVRDLGVIARTSVMRYKGTDRSVRQIGQELKVDYVLEGSVRGNGGQVRVTAQLIRTSAEIHVWADSYDHDGKDLLRIEAEVANRVGEQVRLRVPVVAARGVNADAHLAYLQGRYYWNKRTRADFERGLPSSTRRLPSIGRSRRRTRVWPTATCSSATTATCRLKRRCHGPRKRPIGRSCWTRGWPTVTRRWRLPSRFTIAISGWPSSNSNGHWP